MGRGRSVADGVEVVDVVSTPVSVSRLEPSRDALSNDRRGALKAALRAWARLGLLLQQDQLGRISKCARVCKHVACHFCNARNRGAAACMCRSAKMPADLFCQSGVGPGACGMGVSACCKMS